ncbi:MAG: glycosyltransferase family 4 protein [Bacteroidetes bacterium]|nr:glycosyltransferase family 4 protein [Bacteroidota bacterium]
MKILIVCTGNFGFIKPFVSEQVDAIQRKGIEVDYFLIKGKGIFGYLKNVSNYRRIANNGSYDLIHAHVGLSGFFALFQRKVPVVITFHGVDLIDEKNEFCKTSQIKKRYVVLSRIAAKYSEYNIFVNSNIKVYPNKKHSIISCGVDLNTFFPIDKNECREKLNLSKERKLVLYGTSFDYGVRKNYKLAVNAIANIENVELLEIKNVNREKVNLLMNACDVLLMTSFFETGPQVVKEAMACNCPIVTTDVGDVREVIGDTEGCYITSYEPEDVAAKIKLALEFGKRTNGRERMGAYENSVIADRIIEIYREVLGRK